MAGCITSDYQSDALRAIGTTYAKYLVRMRGYDPPASPPRTVRSAS